VGTPEGNGWAVETAAEAGAPGPTGIAATDEGVVVAYGSEGQTRLAEPAGDVWRSETVGEGGLGVSVATDAEGTPHLAWIGGAGGVSHAHPSNGGWEETQVASPGSAIEDGRTSIAVDEEGIHHIVWEGTEGIGYADNEEGDFQQRELEAEGGTRPAVATGPEGTVYVGWFDPEDTEVQLAVRTEEPPPLALPSSSPTAAGTPTGQDGGAPACEPQGTELQIAAPPGAAGAGFSTNCLAAPAGEAFTIDFNNEDQGVTHNVSIYPEQGSTDALFEGEIFAGPETMTYDVDPIEETGELFFQCDVHASTMTGTFVVAK
jgi:hypothetical protein